MKILFLGGTLRSLENLGTVPDQLMAKGHKTLSLLYPLPGDRTHDLLLLRKDTRFHLLEHSFTSTEQYFKSVRSEDFLKAVAWKVEYFDPDILFLAVNTLPFMMLKADLRPYLKPRKAERLWIGFQHGLVQRWGEMNQNDTCDVFLTFGERDRLRLAPAKRPASIAVGFPKLDRLAEVPTSDDKFILYATDGRAEAIKPVSHLLEELEERTGLPVYIRDHPVSRGAYRISPRQPRDPDLLALVQAEDPVPAVARCSALVTHYSTLGIEALALGKPLVVLPLDEGFDTFQGLPGLASSLDVPDVLQALDAARNGRKQADRLLQDLVGPSLFSHGARMVAALESLMDPGKPHAALRPPETTSHLPPRLSVNFHYNPAEALFSIHGFVLSDPPAIRVVARHQGEVLGAAEVNGRRLDVEGAFPEYGYLLPGWRILCQREAWPAGLLDIEIHDIHGGLSRHRVQIRLPVPG